MLFWHTGGTIALIRYAFRDPHMDLRFLMVGALLPDLLDTPVGLIFYDRLQAVRLVAHAFVFGVTLMIVVLVATRRGRPRKRWMPLAVGVLMHLLLDAMWNDAETLWWPFLGWEFTAAGPATAAEYVRSILTDWRVWALEAVGALYLVYLAHRGNLEARAARDEFLATGVIHVPIERG